MDGATTAGRTDWARVARLHALFQHSPSNCNEPKLSSKVLHLREGERLCEDVGDHILGRAIDEPNRAVFDDPANEMEVNVDVLAARMVLVVLRERNSRLVVGEQSGGVEHGPEDLGDESTEPKRFLRGVRSRDVFGLGGGKGYDLLAFSTPRNGAAVQQKGVP